MKIFINSGLAGPDEHYERPEMTDGEIRGAVRAAAEHDTYVVAHSGEPTAIRQALAQGVRCFEHAYRLDDETAALLARPGIFVTPTLCVTRSESWNRLFGQKIFITYGEHDMAENIVHLVLARLPDAPPGTRGLSLFLAPKFLVNDDGSLGARNDLRCAGIEHKLGIHGSPTCVMIYGENDGAKAWLVGEENRGLAAMFVMMNAARLRSARRASRSPSAPISRRWPTRASAGRAAGPNGDGMAPIIEHADVRRMLMTMKANIQAARGICHLTGVGARPRRPRRRPKRERTAAANRAAC